MIRRLLAVVICGGALVAIPARAAEITVPMNLVSDRGIGAGIGTVAIREDPTGLVFTPHLTGLAPGAHGFHVHQNPDCAPAEKDGAAVPALAAGGHVDPAGTGRHEGPAGKGHLGDLPLLIVGEDGTATSAVVAPRLTLADVTGRSLMVHAGGDSYADLPAPLGGGGARVACGVIR